MTSVRDLFKAKRYAPTETRRPYMTAKNIEGAKSPLNGTPPTGEGNVNFDDIDEGPETR